MRETYRLQTDAPPGWSWNDYRPWLRAEWASLLRRPGIAEPEVHSFLEAHPSLIPGGEGGDRSIGGHHGSFPEAVFTRPVLPGLERPAPDFMWLTKNSEEFIPVLIELERPSKRWFRSDGVQSADLTQAVGQIAHWKEWFADPENLQQFHELYEIDRHSRDWLTFQPLFCLIYGRRSEFSGNKRISRRRSHLRPDAVKWMTYDRLTPHEISKIASPFVFGAESLRPFRFHRPFVLARQLPRISSGSRGWKWRWARALTCLPIGESF